MFGKPFGVILLGAACLAAGLAGITAFGVFAVAFVSRTGISPRDMLVALVWSCIYVVTAVLTWRRSRLAAPGLLAAMGLLVLVVWLTLPGHQLLLLPLFVVTFPFAFFGYRYLRRACEPAGLI